MMTPHYTSGRIDLDITALDPISHGAGTEGNTSLLRTQAIVIDDKGEPRSVSVPFVSGNSLKHTIREAGVHHALEVMGVPDGSITKPVVDLLFSGGHLSKSGAAVDLSRVRRLADLFPILSLCGYSAGNFMTSSKLQVDHIHLVCHENRFRAPERLEDSAHLERYAGFFRGEEFGTRHDSLRSPHVARLLTSEDSARIEEKKTKALLKSEESAKGSKSGKATADKSQKGDSAQMIYEVQVIKPGAQLFGGITFRDLTEMEMSAFRAALGTAVVGQHGEDSYIMRLGGKSSVGFGRVAVRFHGSIRRVSTPVYEPTGDLIPRKDIDGAYLDHLTKRRDEILEALDEAMR